MKTLKEGRYGKMLVNYFEGSSEHNVFVKKDNLENHATGRTISWSDQTISDIPVANSIDDPVQTERNVPFISLGHEMAHVIDMYKKRNLDGKTEGTAMFFENLIRMEHGMTQRTYHGIKDGKTDFDSEAAPTFPTLQILIPPYNNLRNE